MWLVQYTLQYTRTQVILFLRGTRKTRPCLTGHIVFVRKSDFVITVLPTLKTFDFFFFLIFKTRKLFYIIMMKGLISGVLFALFSGQPLNLLGSTGLDKLLNYVKFCNVTRKQKVQQISISWVKLLYFLVEFFFYLKKTFQATYLCRWNCIIFCSRLSRSWEVWRGRLQVRSTCLRRSSTRCARTRTGTTCPSGKTLKKSQPPPFLTLSGKIIFVLLWLYFFSVLKEVREIT